MFIDKKMKISLSAANHLTMSKLYLHDRTTLPEISKVAKKLLGIHASRFKSPFYSLAARVNAQSLDEIARKVASSIDLTKIRCMRGTLHIVNLSDARIYHKATLTQRLRTCSYLLKRAGLQQSDKKLIQGKILDCLKNGPKVIGAIICECDKTLRTHYTYEPHLIKLVLRTLWEEGKLCIDNMSEAWELEKRRYYLTEIKLGFHSLDGIPKDVAETELIKLYFRTYGPATIEDAMWWSGLGANRIKTVLKDFSHEFVALSIDSMSEVFIISNRDLETLHSSTNKEPIVRLLAYEDNLLKAYKVSRKRFLSPKYFNLVYNRAGEAVPTILVNGFVAGTWIHDHSKDKLNLNILKKLPKYIVILMKKEAERLALMANITNVSISITEGCASRINT
jgi:hypothetical protein